MEVRQPLRFLGKEIQKFPLRHQDHVLAARRQLCEVADDEAVLADFGGDCFDLVMRTRKQAVQQAEPVEHVQRRRMDGVAAKIAQEILVLFENDDVDAGTRQKIAADKPCRAAACDDALGRELFHESTLAGTGDVANVSLLV
jgi:hypothetical protein